MRGCRQENREKNSNFRKVSLFRTTTINIIENDYTRTLITIDKHKYPIREELEHCSKEKSEQGIVEGKIISPQENIAKKKY